MNNFQITSALVPMSTDDPSVAALRQAVAAHLARYTGQTRTHTESDLRAFLTWCDERHLDSLAAHRVHVELYVRWMQETRRYKPSTISRRLSVVIGFYRTAVIDGVLTASPADHVRRPHVPPESPTLGLSHLQFEAMLQAGRASININDFALVTMLGLLGLRIFEACGANIQDLREEHGHRVLKVRGKGGKVVLTPLPQPCSAPSNAPSTTGKKGRSCGTGRAGGWTGTPRPVACTTWPTRPGSTFPGCTRTCSGTPSSPPCSTPASTCATSRSPPATPTPAPPCATTGHARTSTVTPTTSSPPTWPPAPDERPVLVRPAQLSGANPLVLWYCGQYHRVVPSVAKILAQMRVNPANIRYEDLAKVCEHYFGPPRTSGGSHAVYKTPWRGDPRVNIQNDHGKAKPYQVRQVLAAIDKKEAAQ